MSKKKRASATGKANQNGGLVDQARQIAEGAFQDFQKRLPPDLVKQLEKSIAQGQKALQANLKRVQDEVRRTARRPSGGRTSRTPASKASTPQASTTKAPGTRTSTAKSTTARAGRTNSSSRKPASGRSATTGGAQPTAPQTPPATQPGEESSTTS